MLKLLIFLVSVGYVFGQAYFAPGKFCVLAFFLDGEKCFLSKSKICAALLQTHI